MSSLWWFTDQEGGTLCLGTEPSSSAEKIIDTQIIPMPPIKRTLSVDEETRVGNIYSASDAKIRELAVNFLANAPRTLYGGE